MEEGELLHKAVSPPVGPVPPPDRPIFRLDPATASCRQFQPESKVAVAGAGPGEATACLSSYSGSMGEQGPTAGTADQQMY